MIALGLAIISCLPILLNPSDRVIVIRASFRGPSEIITGGGGILDCVPMKSGLSSSNIESNLGTSLTTNLEHPYR